MTHVSQELPGQEIHKKLFFSRTEKKRKRRNESTESKMGHIKCTNIHEIGGPTGEARGRSS